MTAPSRARWSRPAKSRSASPARFAAPRSPGVANAARRTSTSRRPRSVVAALAVLLPWRGPYTPHITFVASNSTYAEPAAWLITPVLMTARTRDGGGRAGAGRQPERRRWRGRVKGTDARGGGGDATSRTHISGASVPRHVRPRARSPWRPASTRERSAAGDGAGAARVRMTTGHAFQGPRHISTTHQATSLTTPRRARCPRRDALGARCAHPTPSTRWDARARGSPAGPRSPIPPSSAEDLARRLGAPPIRPRHPTPRSELAPPSPAQRVPPPARPPPDAATAPPHLLTWETLVPWPPRARPPRASADADGSPDAPGWDPRARGRDGDSRARAARSSSGAAEPPLRATRSRRGRAAAALRPRRGVARALREDGALRSARAEARRREAKAAAVTRARNAAAARAEAEVERLLAARRDAEAREATARPGEDPEDHSGGGEGEEGGFGFSAFSASRGRGEEAARLYGAEGAAAVAALEARLDADYDDVLLRRAPKHWPCEPLNPGA